MSLAHRQAAGRRRIVSASICSVAVLAAALLGAHQTGVAIEGALYLLPAAGLALVLMCGRYPGERALKRLRAGRTMLPRATRTAGASTPERRHTESHVLRGGRLIAVSLAGRAPPATAAVCCC